MHLIVSSVFPVGKCEKIWNQKQPFFSGKYRRIVDILHGRLRPGLVFRVKSRTCNLHSAKATLKSICFLSSG